MLDTFYMNHSERLTALIIILKIQPQTHETSDTSFLNHEKTAKIQTVLRTNQNFTNLGLDAMMTDLDLIIRILKLLHEVCAVLNVQNDTDHYRLNDLNVTPL